MKKFTFFFVCVLFIIGCQSCSKKDLPDPEPVKIFHTVTVQNADGVTISPVLPNNSTKVENGKPFSLGFNSGLDKKYKVLANGVTVADFRTGSFDYSVTSVNTDLSIQIVTEAVTFAVTATAGIGGTVTCSSTVEYGKDLPLNIVEDPAYTLTSIKVNGVSMVVSKPYTVKNITSITDVKCEFTLTQILTITNGANDKSRYWKWTKWEVFDANHVYETSYTLAPEQLAGKYYFYTTGKTDMVDDKGAIWPDYWNILLGNVYTLSSGVRIFTIIELTDTKFVYEQKGQFTIGVTEYMRMTYERK